MLNTLPIRPCVCGLWLLVLVVAMSGSATAQELTYAINVKYPTRLIKDQSQTTVSLKEALQKLQKQLSLSLIYNPSDVSDLVVPSSDLETALLLKNVEKVLKETNLTAHKISDNVYVIKSKNTQLNLNVPKMGVKITDLPYGQTPVAPSVSAQNLPRLAMADVASTNRNGQTLNFKLTIDKTISGQVRNTEGDETLPGVSIVVKENMKVGTVTDDQGAFTLAVPDNAKYLVLSLVLKQKKSKSAIENCLTLS